MDEELALLERRARVDPADLEGLERLARARARVGWRHRGKSLEEWVASLRRGKRLDPCDLEALGPALVPLLLDAFRREGERLGGAGAHDDQQVWLWTAKSPRPASRARGRLAELLGGLGALAAAGVPELERALDDFSVCVNRDSGKTAEQVHVCARAAEALAAIGPAAAPALATALGSRRVCQRFFEPGARGGDPTTLGELALEGLIRIGPPAVPALEAALASPCAEARRHARRALRRLGQRAPSA